MKPQDELETIRAYRAMFLNEDGTYKPDAERVMRDLEARCGWMPSGLPTDGRGAVDPLKLAAESERRLIYAHIKKRLHGPLDNLMRMIERTTNE